ncbi:MAG: hypothetical protein P4M15_09475 [Alphaproteobacteria bacterium]|nr:hypothetical protein [Alphaproteobacteria bacterium]
MQVKDEQLLKAYQDLRTLLEIHRNDRDSAIYAAEKEHARNVQTACESYEATVKQIEKGLY